MYIVSDRHGRRIETIETFYQGKEILTARYPWFYARDSWIYILANHELELEWYIPITVTVDVTEYEAQLTASCNSPYKDEILAMANAIEKHGWRAS
jgi:hypothetical protein